MAYKRLLALILFTPLLVFAQADSSGKNNSFLVLPLVAKSIETGWSFGAAGSYTFHISKKDSLLRTSNIQSLVLYSTKKQLVTAINGSIYFPGEKYILNHQLSYSSFPDKFWGLGKHAKDVNEEAYKFQQYYIYLHLLKKIRNNFFLGALFEFQNVFKVDYQPGGLFDQQMVAGRNGYHVSGLGLSATYDSRNNAFSPDKGFFSQVYFNHFNHLFGSGYNYTNIVIDIRKFYALAPKQVLALQLYSFSNLGSEVPIRSLASFGGSNSMRGYYDGRFRDKGQLVLQAEYRWHIKGRFGLVAFGGAGDVGHTLIDFQLRELKYSYGTGLRFALNKREKLNLRFDYGFGTSHNKGFYIQLGEAF